MAGTVTQTLSKHMSIKIWTLTITADASDGSVPNTASSEQIVGRLQKIVTNPGSTAPTDNYDITVTDPDGVDVLQGVGANRDTANSEEAAIVYSGTSVNPVVADTLTLVVANNSVNSAGIVVKIYYTGA